MGYSASANAIDRYKMILAADDSRPETNVWTKDDGREFFCEIGRENRDMTVTGTVFEMVYTAQQTTLAYRRGSFKIDNNGKVVRFPHMSKKMRAASKTALPQYGVL